jgi:hypothetical protein
MMNQRPPHIRSSVPTNRPVKIGYSSYRHVSTSVFSDEYYVVRQAFDELTTGFLGFSFGIFKPDLVYPFTDITTEPRYSNIQTLCPGIGRTVDGSSFFYRINFFPIPAEFYNAIVPYPGSFIGFISGLGDTSRVVRLPRQNVSYFDFSILSPNWNDISSLLDDRIFICNNSSYPSEYLFSTTGGGSVSNYSDSFLTTGISGGLGFIFNTPRYFGHEVFKVVGIKGEVSPQVQESYISPVTQVDDYFGTGLQLGGTKTFDKLNPFRKVNRGAYQPFRLNDGSTFLNNSGKIVSSLDTTLDFVFSTFPESAIYLTVCDVWRKISRNAVGFTSYVPYEYNPNAPAPPPPSGLIKTWTPYYGGGSITSTPGVKYLGACTTWTDYNYNVHYVPNPDFVTPTTKGQTVTFESGPSFQIIPPSNLLLSWANSLLNDLPSKSSSFVGQEINSSSILSACDSQQFTIRLGDIGFDESTLPNYEETPYQYSIIVDNPGVFVGIWYQNFPRYVYINVDWYTYFSTYPEWSIYDFYMYVKFSYIPYFQESVNEVINESHPRYSGTEHTIKIKNIYESKNKVGSWLRYRKPVDFSLKDTSLGQQGYIPQNFLDGTFRFAVIKRHLTAEDVPDPFNIVLEDFGADILYLSKPISVSTLNQEQPTGTFPIVSSVSKNSDTKKYFMDTIFKGFKGKIEGTDYTYSPELFNFGNLSFSSFTGVDGSGTAPATYFEYSLNSLPSTGMSSLSTGAHPKQLPVGIPKQLTYYNKTSAEKTFLPETSNAIPFSLSPVIAQEDYPDDILYYYLDFAHRVDIKIPFYGWLIKDSAAQFSMDLKAKLYVKNNMQRSIYTKNGVSDYVEVLPATTYQDIGEIISFYFGFGGASNSTFQVYKYRETIPDEFEITTSSPYYARGVGNHSSQELLNFAYEVYFRYFPLTFFFPNIDGTQVHATATTSGTPVHPGYSDSGVLKVYDDASVDFMIVFPNSHGGSEYRTPEDILNDPNGLSVQFGTIRAKYVPVNFYKQ